VADRARRHRTRPRPATVEFVETSVENTAQKLAAHDLDLERAVAGLSGRQRRAVDLYYFDGLDVATCAEGTVKATLFQARERLRGLLGDDFSGGMR
jgi:DNA-directed RNA polymerase specialized sigma24 family protein